MPEPSIESSPKASFAKECELVLSNGSDPKLSRVNFRLEFRVGGGTERGGGDEARGAGAWVSREEGVSQSVQKPVGVEGDSVGVDAESALDSAMDGG